MPSKINTGRSNRRLKSTREDGYAEGLGSLKCVATSRLKTKKPFRETDTA